MIRGDVDVRDIWVLGLLGFGSTPTESDEMPFLLDVINGDESEV